MKSFWILGIVSLFELLELSQWVPTVWMVTVEVLQCQVFLLRWERGEARKKCWYLAMTVAYHSYIRVVSSEQKNVFCFFFLMPIICLRYLLLVNQINKVSVFKELPFFSGSLVMPFQTLFGYNLYFLWPSESTFLNYNCFFL